MSGLKSELRQVNVKAKKLGSAVEHNRSELASVYLAKDAPDRYTSLVAVLEETCGIRSSIEGFMADEGDGSRGEVAQENRGLRILLCVRVLCTLHRSFYFSILAETLFKQLADALKVQDVFVDIGITQIVFQFDNRTWLTNEVADYDIRTISTVTKLAQLVMRKEVSVSKALKFMDVVESGQDVPKWEKSYRDFPGRALIFPIMGFTCAPLFFSGSGYDLLWTLFAGSLIALYVLGSRNLSVFDGMQDSIVAGIAGVVAQIALHVSADTCVTSIILGNLYFFLYGTAYTLGCYEAIEGIFVRGVVRVYGVVFKSYNLAISSILGMWIVNLFAGNRPTINMNACTENNLDYFSFLFPLCGLACLAQFRVASEHLLMCLFIQTCGYIIQQALAGYGQNPSFVENMVPAFSCVILSYLLIWMGHLSCCICGRNRACCGFKWSTIQKTFFGSFEDFGAKKDKRNRLKLTEGDFKELANLYTDVWGIMITALYILVPGSRILTDGFAVFIQGSELFIVNATRAQIAQISEADFIGAGFTGGLISIGISLCVGMKIGFFTLNIGRSVYSYASEKCKRSAIPSGDASGASTNNGKAQMSEEHENDVEMA